MINSVAVRKHYSYPCFGVVLKVIFWGAGEDTLDSSDAWLAEEGKCIANLKWSVQCLPAVKKPLMSAWAILPLPIKPISILS